MAEISLKKRIWGWYFFDWASQPYHTVLLTFIFGPFFVSLAQDAFLAEGLDAEAAKASAQSMWATTLTITGLIIGFGAPFLGAIADTSGNRLPWILAFSVMYVAGAALAGLCFYSAIAVKAQIRRTLPQKLFDGI